MTGSAVVARPMTPAEILAAITARGMAQVEADRDRVAAAVRARAQAVIDDVVPAVPPRIAVSAVDVTPDEMVLPADAVRLAQYVEEHDSGRARLTYAMAVVGAELVETIAVRFVVLTERGWALWTNGGFTAGWMVGPEHGLRKVGIRDMKKYVRMRWQ